MTTVYTAPERGAASSWRYLSEMEQEDSTLQQPTQDATGTSNDIVESQSTKHLKSAANLKLELLKLLTRYPGLDDVELAGRLCEPAFEISSCLRELAAEGLIEEAE